MPETKHLIGQLELKAEGPEGAFRAVFSTMSVIDKDGDVTLPGAFRDGQEVRIAYWGHRWQDLPVGKGVIHADEREAWVDGQFFTDTTPGLDTYRTVKNLASLQEWSYGFDVTEWSSGEFEGQDVRFLRGLNVHEVSPVMLGAGIGTHTESIKSAEPAGEPEPYDEHSERVRVAVLEWVERTKSGSELRAKEGRAISETRRGRMATVRDQLRVGADEIDGLLVETEPKPKGVDPAILAELLRYQRFRARQFIGA